MIASIFIVFAFGFIDNKFLFHMCKVSNDSLNTVI